MKPSRFFLSFTTMEMHSDKYVYNKEIMLHISEPYMVSY